LVERKNLTMAIVHEGEHSYASRGVGNAALTTGIIGTSGFGLNLLNSLTGGGGIFGRQSCPVPSEDHCVNRYEAAQQARIAELETEVKLRDSNTYTDQKILDVYKYFDSENKQIRSDICEMKAQQGVINANLIAGLDVLKSQASETRAVLDSITKTAVPTSAICNFGCGCNSCSGNI
jgi:hypothetical protein